MSAPLLLTEHGRQQLLEDYHGKLLNETVPFWFPRCVDREHGGFLHCVDRDGTLVDSDKSVWAQGRMSWMLLTLYNTIEKKSDWLEWAESGLQFLKKHCFDSDGRMFFHMTGSGQPIRKRRYAYSEAFASIAFAAHAKATGSDESAHRAVQLFEHFLDWNFTPGKMSSKFTDERPMIGMTPRMISIVTAQELRANLGDQRWDPTIDHCVEEIERYLVKPDFQVVMEAVAVDGSIVDHFDGRLLNPGHAIEGAWFIMREGQYRGDQSMISLGTRMLDWMWGRGWDKEFGGLYYFRDVYEKPVQEYWHDMKFWWPHNETIIATLLAWKLTGDEKYARWHQQIHDWSHRHFSDPVHGEWFGYLHRDGRLSTTLKGNLWKSFFHHPRMQWACGRILQSESI